MTVGELRKALEGLPDDMKVAATYDSGYPADVESASVKPNHHFYPGQQVLVIEVDS